MTFEEWAEQTFGSGFINEEPITYFRMSAAWGRAQDELADWIEPQRNDIPATGEEFAAAIRMRSNGRSDSTEVLGTEQTKE